METGWCNQCSDAVVVEKYIAREEAAIAERRRKWRKGTAKRGSDAPEALKWRQRKHRLYAAVQPMERPDANSDPWQIAFEGLQALKKIRGSMKGVWAQQYVEIVAECIRQSAMGPED
jgi:hypothetical protein